MDGLALSAPENDRIAKVKDVFELDQLLPTASNANKDARAEQETAGIEIQDGKVRLVHLIRARLWTSNLDPADVLSVTYRKLIEVAEESNVETELTPIAG